MNELSNDGSYSELKAELQALREKLEDLETKQAASKSGTGPSAGGRFPKKLVIACLLLTALSVAGGVLWGDEAIKALSIDEQGNIGIGRPPLTGIRLLVAANGDKQPFNVATPEGVPWLSVKQNGDVLMRGGNVGIGGNLEPKKKLDVTGDARVSGGLTAGELGTGSLTATSADVSGLVKGNSFSTTGSLEAGSATVKGAVKALSLETTGGSWVQGSSTVDGLLKANQGLTVTGDATFTGTINGEKPPKVIRFDIPQAGTVTKDISEVCIGGLCRILLLMTHQDGTFEAGTEDIYCIPHAPKCISLQDGGASKRTVWLWNSKDQVFKWHDTWCQADIISAWNWSYSCQANVRAKVIVYGE